MRKALRLVSAVSFPLKVLHVLVERQDKYADSCAEVMASQTTPQGGYMTWGRYEGKSKDVIFLIQISEFPTRFGDTYVPKDFINGDFEDGKMIHVS